MRNAFKEMEHLLHFKEMRGIVNALNSIDIPDRQIPHLRAELEALWEHLGERQDAYMFLHE